jgi:hypothetical protein
MSDTDKTSMLDTKFVSPEDTEKLLQVIELALDDLDQVAGGECSCVNCCNNHVRAVARA